MEYEYRVKCFTEGILESILLGNAKTKIGKVEDELNQLGRCGWKLVSVEREIQSLFWFWKREAMIAVLYRPIPKTN